MIYMFPETEKANERAKEILEPVKEVYNKPQMTKEQLENLRQVMQKAKEEIDSAENNIKRKVSVRTRWRRFAVTAAAFVAVFIILPNTSASAAYAMGELPSSARRESGTKGRQYDSGRHKTEYLPLEKR